MYLCPLFHTLCWILLIVIYSWPIYSLAGARCTSCRLHDSDAFPRVGDSWHSWGGRGRFVEALVAAGAGQPRTDGSCVRARQRHLHLFASLGSSRSEVGATYVGAWCVCDQLTFRMLMCPNALDLHERERERESLRKGKRSTSSKLLHSPWHGSSTVFCILCSRVMLFKIPPARN